MACDVIDLKCILVNEIIGSVVLSIIFLAVIYFIISSKLRFGFETTIVLGIVILILGSLAIGNLAAVLAFLTLLIAVLLGIKFSNLLGN